MLTPENSNPSGIDWEKVDYYAFDLDGTLCTYSKSCMYDDVKPIKDRIAKVNQLRKEGKLIKIYTARGMGQCNGNLQQVYDQFYDLTKSQLKKWGVQYTQLVMGKASYDILIDDKAVNDRVFFNECPVKAPTRIGIIAGAFDVLHLGYIRMFKEMREQCDQINVFVHEDPSMERPDKMKPVHSIHDRIEMVEALGGVTHVTIYQTEDDLRSYLQNYKGYAKNSDGRVIVTRFLGDDYKDKYFTGQEVNIPVVFLDRSHGWSATKYKNLITDSVLAARHDVSPNPSANENPR